MHRKNGTESRSTTALVAAGEILRTLNPPTLAALLFVLEDNTRTQAEMADTIGCSRSSMSKYLQSLSNSPLALVRKQQGRRYTVTEVGKKTVGMVGDMLDRLKLDLQTISWESDTDREKMASQLAPLYGSRSSRTFFALDSLRVRSGGVGQTTSNRVWIEDVIHDVDVFLQERDESATSEQIRHTLRRFDNNSSVEFDGEYITLTKKGKAHAKLLDQLAVLIEGQYDSDITTGEESDQASLSGNSSTNSNIDQSKADNIAQQLTPRGFSGGSQRTIDSPDANTPSKQLSIVPAYCLKATGDEGAKEKSNPQSQPFPILPLTTMTIAELTNAVNRLKQQYNEEAKVEPYWALQTRSGLYPLGPAQLSPSLDILY
ncbi:hypothetical protein ACFQL7_27930 [Halocatena marina]|uniref:Uncharacterized protein n=1 Tax=Halocatena marina TaxID=2934937 RepID=A0ABD5YY19_9EURY